VDRKSGQNPTSKNPSSFSNFKGAQNLAMSATPTPKPQIFSSDTEKERKKERKKDKAHQDTVAIRETMNIGRLVIDHRHHRLRHRHLRIPLLPPLRKRTISPSTTKQKPSQNPKTVITGKRLGNPKTQSWVIFVKDSICFCSNHPIYCFLLIYNTKAFENSGIELC
jgi:hypothetical protein